MIIKKHKKKKSAANKKVALALIFSSVFVVLVGTITMFFFTPNQVAKRSLEYLAKDYYETYYYPQLAESANAAEILAEYTENGLPSVNLNQLLMFDNGRNYDLMGDFTSSNYECSLENTSVKYFPVEPYGQEDYKIVYNYACIGN